MYLAKILVECKYTVNFIKQQKVLDVYGPDKFLPPQTAEID